MDLLQNVIHGVPDGARDGAVDSRGRGLVLQRAGVRGHTTRGNRAAAQGPEEPLIPMLADVLALDIGERTSHALISVVHRLIDGGAVLRSEAVLLIPDVQRCVLEWNGIDVLRFDFHDGVHGSAALRLFCFPQAPSTEKRHRARSRAGVLLWTSPRPRDIASLQRNTRSCVGVKRLVTLNAPVNIWRQIL